MSTPHPSAVLTPSWRTALGLFAITIGYLIALLGVVFYAWAGLHTLYRVPVLIVPVVGLLVAIVGGAMVRSERR